MRIVYIGSVRFSLAALQKLVSLRVNIVGICTLKSSSFNSDHVDLTSLGTTCGIPCYYADDINSHESLMWIRSKAPDVIFCFGWSRLLKNELLGVAPLGVVGFHPAPLPANRGRHPIIWALALGLRKTASTFFFMNEGADTGEIISQRDILISDDDNASTLYEKIINAAHLQIAEFIPELEGGMVKTTKQNEFLSNVWRKRSERDGVIDWRMSAKCIHNLVRALSSPYNGADFVVNGRVFKLWESMLAGRVSDNIEPGKVFAYSDFGPLVKCGEDAICLTKCEPLFEPNVGDYL